MPRKGRSNEEIIHALGQVESGKKVAEVCRAAADVLDRHLTLRMVLAAIGNWRGDCALLSR